LKKVTTEYQNKSVLSYFFQKKKKMTSRRERNETHQDQSDQRELTDFQKRCKEVLETELKFTKVVDGTTFGAHLHCYRGGGGAGEDSSSQHHQHGEALVLCVENSTTENLDADLRYLSVASRIANTTKKRCLVAFETKTSKKIKIIELVSIT
jgi:hypothetical protein